MQRDAISDIDRLALHMREFRLSAELPSVLRYEEVDPYPIIGTLYVRKTAFIRLPRPPQRLRIVVLREEVR